MRIPEDATPRERKLHAIIARLEARIAGLEAELAKARRNSSNSSKPPSSDIVKPTKPSRPRGRSRRTRGGQPGHPKHERANFPPDQVDRIHTHNMRRCPKTACRLRRAKVPPRTLQQIGLAEKPFVVLYPTPPSQCCPGLNQAEIRILLAGEWLSADTYSRTGLPGRRRIVDTQVGQPYPLAG